LITASLNFPTTPYPVSAVVTSCVRNDTGGSVGASIGGSGANWILSITEPAPNLTYTYQVTFTFAGSIQSVASGTVNGTVSTPTGYYTNYGLMCQKYGTINITRWSNTDNLDVLPNYSNITLGIGVAESQINQFFANGPYNVPLAPINYTISDWATSLAALWVYETRGMFEDNPQANKLTPDAKNAWRWMAAYKGNTSTLTLGTAQRRWPTPTAAVAARGFR